MAGRDARGRGGTRSSTTSRPPLAWLADHGDADGDGFLEYLDASGHGLTNQGWKDSGDSIRWHDGTIAEGPIALCEVQAYAYEAARDGAAVLDAFGRAGGERWRDWAAALRDRFRSAFWCEDAQGAYPALALDVHKRPVDGSAPTSATCSGPASWTRTSSARSSTGC